MTRLKTIALLAVLVGFAGADHRACGQDARAAEQRLAELERQVDQILQEVRALRKQAEPKRMSQAIRLKNAHASEIVEPLNLLVGGKDRGIELIAEPISNSLLVSAPLEKYDEVIKLIAAVDALSK